MEDEDAPYPSTLQLAGYVEAFPGRFLSEIIREIRRWPVGFVDEVLEAKAFREVWSIYSAADTKEKVERLPTSKFFELAGEIDGELAQEYMDARKRG